MRILFGADHAGFEMKRELMSFVLEMGFEVEDKGAFSFAEDDDYPDFVAPVAREVSENPDSTRGIVLGGSGQGEAIVANRFPYVRAVVFTIPLVIKGEEGKEEDDDVIRLSREHNDSNVLSLGARFLTLDQARRAASLWLQTPFKGEERHLRRIRKIDNL